MKFEEITWVEDENALNEGWDSIVPVQVRGRVEVDGETYEVNFRMRSQLAILTVGKSEWVLYAERAYELRDLDGKPYEIVNDPDAEEYQFEDKVLLDNISAKDICRELVAELRNWDDWKGQSYRDSLKVAFDDGAAKAVTADRGVVDSYEKDGADHEVQEYAYIPCPDRVALYLDSDGKLVRREVESSLQPGGEPVRDTFRTVTTGRPRPSNQERSSRSFGR